MSTYTPVARLEPPDVIFSNIVIGPINKKTKQLKNGKTISYSEIGLKYLDDSGKECSLHISAPLQVMPNGICTDENAEGGDKSFLYAKFITEADKVAWDMLHDKQRKDIENYKKFLIDLHTYLDTKIAELYTARNKSTPVKVVTPKLKPIIFTADDGSMPGIYYKLFDYSQFDKKDADDNSQSDKKVPFKGNNKTLFNLVCRDVTNKIKYIPKTWDELKQKCILCKPIVHLRHFYVNAHGIAFLQNSMKSGAITVITDRITGGISSKDIEYFSQYMDMLPSEVTLGTRTEKIEDNTGDSNEIDMDAFLNKK